MAARIHYRIANSVSKRRAALAGTLLAVGALTFGDTSVGPWSSPAYAQSPHAPVGFADVVEKVKPAVISVKVQMGTAARQGRQMVAQGSGFFVSADGYAVTNNHVVDKARQVEVTTDEGKAYAARVVGTDARSDLALIKVDGRNDFPFAHLSEKRPRVGDWVLAVGNPFGLGGTVTAGIVSARGRNIGEGHYEDFIQIDAPVNRGNSGGPTFDTEGDVIGVNTAIASPSGGSVGIAFAIPADAVKRVVAQLKAHGTVARGWMGVQIEQVTPEIAKGLGMPNGRGALVKGVESDSPAQKAGIRTGDVITAVDGRSIDDARSLGQRIGALAPKTAVRLHIVRNGRGSTVTVTLAELPNEREASRD